MKKSFHQLIALGMGIIISGISPLCALAETPSLTEKFLGMERGLEKEFEDYFGENMAEVTQTPEQIAETLRRIGQETATNPAVLWVMPKEDHLHLVLILPGETPIVKDLYDVPSSVLIKTAKTLQENINSPLDNNYLKSSQQLHKWIIEPIEKEFLQKRKIDTLLLCVGEGLRGLPLAVLHDGKQFLIEKYSLSHIPAFNLINTEYRPMKYGQILAMGASEFQNQNPLPAVPVELSNIIWELRRQLKPDEKWQGKKFLNRDFTLANLQNNLNQEPFNIVHLATHAEFAQGKPENSYIQFADTRLKLNEINQINWNKPPVELLVLSACETAVGDPEAELGFAGLALKSGVKSVLASLWYISDPGTLALMNEFYRQLGLASTKAEALQQTQIAMIKGKLRFQNGQLLYSRGSVPLPKQLGLTDQLDLSHPFFWASFTLISSPW
jgi:CHAT domain-containing protein